MSSSYPLLRALVMGLLLLQAPVAFALDQNTKAPAEKISAQQIIAVRRLVFADSDESANRGASPTELGSVIVRGLPLFESPEFIKLMEPYIGQPIADATVAKLAKDLSVFVRKNDRLTVNVSIPKQNASDGTLRLVLKIGRYGDILFRGNRYFGNEQLLSLIGVKPGEEIRVSKLEEGILWANTSPYRRLQAMVNNIPGDPTKVNLLVGVQEVRPARAIFSYDNGNVDVLGQHRFTGSFTLGNLWKRDHSLNYQISTTSPLALYQVHNLDYRFALPWHHFVDLQFVYSRVTPVFSEGHFRQKGQNVLALGKYIAPFRYKSWNIELSGGLDFKQADNNLEFGGFGTGYGTVSKTKYDILQVNLQATVVRDDKYGSWALIAAGTFSPGDLTPRNNFEIFNKVRNGAEADPNYAKGNFTLQRTLRLPFGFEDIFRATGQITNRNLQGSEQMSIGGLGTVRGYKERIMSGDVGYNITNELYTPVSNVKFSQKQAKALQVRGLAFWDCGEVAYFRRKNNDVYFDPLMSAGIGLRCSLSNRVSISIDHGWQLKLLPITRTKKTETIDGTDYEYYVQNPRPATTRLHVQASVAF